MTYALGYLLVVVSTACVLTPPLQLHGGPAPEMSQDPAAPRRTPVRFGGAYQQGEAVVLVAAAAV